MKKMRLPNGFGSITKLSGNRRRPYIARKLSGYRDDGRPIHSAVGYYETYWQAYEALLALNKTTTATPVITFAKCYHEWYAIHSQEVGPAALESYRSAYGHLSDIVGKPISQLDYATLQAPIDVMRSRGLSYAACKKVRSLLNMVLKYAIIRGHIATNYAQYLKLGKNIPVKPHKPFTRQKINRLWAMNTYEANTVLILMYTGMRCSEMLNLKLSDVNMKSKYFIIRESKTEAGRNRIIPIHDRIFHIVANLRQSSSTYLIERNGRRLSYSQYCEIFTKAMKTIRGEKHTTHDCRHTVASLLDTAGANPSAVRAILGHKNGDITIRVYTHKSLRELRQTINSLK